MTSQQPSFTSPRCVVLALLGGIATWLAWLSWGFEDRAYSTGQVIGCALTAAAAVAALTWVGRPRSAVAGVGVPFAIGLTAAWTVWAARDDESGLFVVGAIMMLIGSGAALGVVALLVERIRHAS